MHTVVDSEAAITSVLIVTVQVVCVLGATEALLLAVLMDAPQDIHTLVDGLLVAEFAKQGGSNCPKGDVLGL